MCSLAMVGVRAEDPVAPAAPATEKAGFVIAKITDFDGTIKFQIMSPAEILKLKKSLPGINEAARKALTKLRKAWHDKYDTDQQVNTTQVTQPAKPLPANVQNSGGIVLDMRSGTTTGTVQQRQKEPPFPIRVVPVKEVRELETCPTEDAAKERVKFYEDREVALKKKTSSDNPFGTTAFAGAGGALGSAKEGKTATKNEQPRSQEVDQQARDDMMKQLTAEVEKILAGTASDTPKAESSSKGPTKKAGLGTGVGNTFKSSSFGTKK